MKKLIISAIAAVSLLFGFASCSNDLHDVEDSPYVNNSNAIYILGGISKSTMKDKEGAEITGTTFADTTAYKVALENGTFEFNFTYHGEDSWSAGDGKTAFAIVADATSNWDAANKMRWGTDSNGVAVGSEASLKGPTQDNAKITGLSAGTEYNVKGSITASGGTIKVTQGLSGVPFELLWLNDNGGATSATSITAVNSYTFTYDIIPASEAKTYKFVARYGNGYYAPSADAEFKIDGTTADAAKGTEQKTYKALKVTIPSAKDAAEDHIGSYKVKLVFPNKDGKLLTDDKLTASVEKIYLNNYAITYLNGSAGNKEIVWDASAKELGSGFYNGKPYSSKKVTLGTIKFPKGTTLTAWGKNSLEFGICKGNNDWSVKYTGAKLEKEGVEYNLKNGANDNNSVPNVTGPLEKDLTITISYIEYEDIFNAGKYENASEWKISYSLN